MAISRDTRIADINFTSAHDSGFGNAKIVGALERQCGLETYGDLLDFLAEGNRLGETRGIGPKIGQIIQDFVAKNPIQNELVIEPASINSFSITTPGTSISEKIEAATVSVADDMKEVAKEQFRNGAVVIGS